MVQATATDAWLGRDTDASTEALLALFRIVRGAQALSHAPLDLGSRRLLGTLAQTGPVRLSDLARESQLDLSTVSRHVAAMAGDGLLEREPDPEDRRACVVALTRRGRELLKDLVARQAAAIAPVLDTWPAGDREQLVVLLTRLADDLQAAATTKDEISP